MTVGIRLNNKHSVHDFCKVSSSKMYQIVTRFTVNLPLSIVTLLAEAIVARRRDGRSAL